MLDVEAAFPCKATFCHRAWGKRAAVPHQLPGVFLFQSLRVQRLAASLAQEGLGWVLGWRHVAAAGFLVSWTRAARAHEAF